MPGKVEKKLVAVIVPVYKQAPDRNEAASLARTIDVLGNHPIYFIGPESLDMTFYERACWNKVAFQTKKFSDIYFSGIEGYNQLMLSKNFYRRFIDFEYLLICQLDAYIFRDELEYWCRSGYDYIGAPYQFVDLDTYPIKMLSRYRGILKRAQKLIPSFYSFRQVGNGGLSLRKVTKTIFLLNFKTLQPRLWRTLMEDNFFQYWGNLLFFVFRLPDTTTAARFSIELDPSRTYELIGNTLPFGCHAYLRYEPVFWRQFIDFTE